MIYIGMIFFILGGIAGVMRALDQIKGPMKPPTAPDRPLTPAERKAAEHWQMND